MYINLNRKLLEEINIPNKPTFRASFAPIFTLALFILFIPYLIRVYSIHTTIIVFSIILGSVLLARFIDRIIDHHVLIIDWILTGLILGVGLPTSFACGVVFMLVVFLSKKLFLKSFPDLFLRILIFCVWLESAIILFMFCVRPIFDDEISNRKDLVVIANHQGLIDFAFAFYLMGFRHKYKVVYGTNLDKYLGRFVASYAKFIGIGVDRKKLRSRANTQLEIDKALKEGYRIMFFPEGTRMRLWQVSMLLLPFKKGGFNTIFENEVPIQAVVFDSPLAYSAPDRKFPFSPGKVKATVSNVIETKGTNQKELLEQIHLEMKAVLSQSQKMKDMIAKQGKLAA